MSHGNHQHSFELKSDNHPFYCGRCEQLGVGSGFKCTDCNIVYHQECGNPTPCVRYPFSSKCYMEFLSTVKTKDKLLGACCDVCCKEITGYHYRCTCSFIKRHAHPSCLTYEHTFEVEGVTFTLYNKLTTNCLGCGSEELGVVPGWAYVSSCGNICFHVSCLKDLILDECKNSSNTQQIGASQTVETQSVADANRGQQVVILREKKNSSIGKLVPVLNAVINLLTGNYIGLIVDAQSFFS